MLRRQELHNVVYAGITYCQCVVCRNYIMSMLCNVLAELIGNGVMYVGIYLARLAVNKSSKYTLLYRRRSLSSLNLMIIHC